MSPEEIAEIVLGEPLYDPCETCGGSGKGEKGISILTGVTDQNSLVRDSTSVIFPCNDCNGHGQKLSMRYLDACRYASVLPKVSHPENPKYLLEVVPSRKLNDIHVNFFNERGEDVFCPWSLRRVHFTDDCNDK